MFKTNFIALCRRLTLGWGGCESLAVAYSFHKTCRYARRRTDAARTIEAECKLILII